MGGHSFKPNLICESCGLWSGAKNPKVLTRQGNMHHPRSAGLIYVLLDSPSESVDEEGNPLLDAQFKVLRGFLDQLPCRWKLGFYARCFPGKDSKNKKIIPTEDQFSTCSQYLYDELLPDQDEGPLVVLALGRRAEEQLLGPTELKRDYAKPYYTAIGTPVILAKSCYVPMSKQQHLIKDYTFAFQACLQFLSGEYKTAEDEEQPYELITSVHHAYEVLKEMPERVFFDIEHSFGNMYDPRSEFLCMCIGWRKEDGTYKIICMPRKVIQPAWIEDWARGRILEAYNVYTDCVSLKIYFGVNVFPLAKKIGDTFLKFFLHDQAQHGNSLEARAMRHLGVKSWKDKLWAYINQATEAIAKAYNEAKAVNRERKKKGLEELPLPELREGHFGDPPKKVLYQYCTQDVWTHMRLELEVAPQCNKTAYDLCIQAIAPLCLMADRGLPMDADWINAYHEASMKKWEQIKAYLKTLKVIQQVEAGWTDPATGEVFKPRAINSKAPLFMTSVSRLLNHHTGKRTAGGGLCFDEEVLDQLAGEYPKIAPEKMEVKHKIFALLRKMRKLRDLESKFFKPFQGYIHNHLAHTTYRIGRTEVAGQTAGSDLSGGTDQGRLSSEKPNLQNIKKDKTFRHAISFSKFPNFFGVKNPILVEVDYSTMELVVLAWMGNVVGMTTAIRAGQDLHRESAKLIWHLDDHEVTKELRDKAKTGNFAKVYGETPFVFANRNHLSLEEAVAFFEGHNKAFPEVEQFFDAIRKAVLQGKAITTPFGRRKTFALTGNRSTDGHILREACNFPIQGTASDMTLLALILIYLQQERDPQLKTHFLPINIVHDAIWFAIDRTMLVPSLELITNLMLDNSKLPFAFDLPRSVGYKIGETGGTWEELKGGLPQIRQYSEFLNQGHTASEAYQMSKELVG